MGDHFQFDDNTKIANATLKEFAKAEKSGAVQPRTFGYDLTNNQNSSSEQEKGPTEKPGCLSLNDKA
jgi:hypothetical protein